MNHELWTTPRAVRTPDAGRRRQRRGCVSYRMVIRGEETDAHVPTQRDLVVREPPLRVHVTQRSDAIDDEAVVLDRRLEALLPVPCANASIVNFHAHAARVSQLSLALPFTRSARGAGPAPGRLRVRVGVRHGIGMRLALGTHRSCCRQQRKVLVSSAL